MSGAGRGAASAARLGAFALLLSVAAAGPSAAKPPLGPRGWAPGDLPVHLGSAATTAVLAAAYLLGVLAVVLGWRAGPLRTGWRWPLLLAGLALCTAPIGSADHTNYAAYGRIAAGGGDPYAVPPVTWAGGLDPVTAAVEPPWQTTPSVYGPVATALHTLASLVGGDNLRQTVWVWQVLVVAAWLLVRLLLLRLAPGRADLLWTFNPVVFGVVVVGAHVDAVATAFAVAACWAAARSPLLVGLALGAAAGTKVTYAVAGLGVLWAWRALPGLARRVGLLGLGALLVLVPAHLWAGPHVFDQLLRARRSVSLATPWRPVVEALPGSRSAVFLLAALLAVVLAVALSRLARARSSVDRSALTATFVLTTAYTLAAPYSLPWYDALTWASLPVLAGGPLDLVLLARLGVLALAYVPGRVVGMTAQVEALTLGFRRQVAPLSVLVAWLAVFVLWRRRHRAVRE
ncbi:MAG TPA: hypothetical protein VFJ97_16705 [Dermatophilaceae bacterium]|nr:hypothetical protein [Dermatophilaceae bacterium]